LDLRAVIDEGLGGLGVEFGVSDTSVAIVQPDEAETDADGAVTTDLIAQSNGTVDLFASSGGASDRITIHLTNVTESGGLNDAPTARFDVSPSDPDAGDVVTFDASASNDPDGSIASYEWDFGDGSTATGETASHAYASTGTYTVTLEVTDDVGATDTATEVVVINQAPTAAFTFSPSTPTTADSIGFDASGSSDPDGSIISYEWDFGDGSLTTGQTAFHSYDQDGTYTVALTVIDTSGSTDTVAKTVQVGNQAPVADFGVSPSPPNAGEPVTFDGTQSDDPDGSIASYQWDLGDGTTAIGETPTHTYDTAGNYTVALTVIDDDGATNTVSETVRIATERPTAAFDYSPTGAATDEPVTFDAAESSDPDGSIASYEWDFDDGTTATGEVVQHSFDDDGPYTVELSVTDDQGGTDTVVKTVRIDNRPPDSDFTYSPGDAGAGESISFDGTASSDPDGSVSAYEWDWDADGTYEDSGATASHAFVESGVHDVGLRVTDDDGKTATVTKEVRVVGWEYNGDAIARDGQDDPTPDRPGGVEFSLTS
jgi:PKD repeat protein